MSEDWSSCYEASAGTTLSEFLSKRWYQLVFSLLKLTDVAFAGNRLLEVGCGKGGFCVFASSLGAEALGLDLAKPAIREASKIDSRLFLVGDARFLPLNKDQFDVVVCADVLEHIYNYECTFAEMVRVCKKRGYLVITTPTRTNITQIFMPFFIFRKRFHIRENQPSDLNIFSLSKLKTLCEQHNLKVLFERGIGMVWLPTGSKSILKLLARLEKPQSFLKSLCINIGVIAQKPGSNS